MSDTDPKRLPTHCLTWAYDHYYVYVPLYTTLFTVKRFLSLYLLYPCSTVTERAPIKAGLSRRSFRFPLVCEFVYSVLCSVFLNCIIVCTLFLRSSIGSTSSVYVGSDISGLAESWSEELVSIGTSGSIIQFSFSTVKIQTQQSCLLLANAFPRCVSSPDPIAVHTRPSPSASTYKFMYASRRPSTFPVQELPTRTNTQPLKKLSEHCIVHSIIH